LSKIPVMSEYPQPSTEPSLPAGLYLLPTPLGELLNDTIPEATIAVLHNTVIFLVEKAKTARHFIKSTRHPVPIQEIIIKEVNQVTPKEDFDFMEHYIKNGYSVGLLSEAGCPAVADPGASVVLLAHQAGMEVVPLVGPSSIMLAVMASGMSGQHFCFHGYIAAKRSKLHHDLQQLELLSRKNRQTQVFIETPYRNGAVIEQALLTLQPETLLGIAADLTMPTRYVKTQTIAAWRKNPPPDLHKRPAIFLIYVL
jgi:16S rRNA (cytidine1402-2'-O)-methyltransferase